MKKITRQKKIHRKRFKIFLYNLFFSSMMKGEIQSKTCLCRTWIIIKTIKVLLIIIISISLASATYKFFNIQYIFVQIAVSQTVYTMIIIITVLCVLFPNCFEFSCASPLNFYIYAYLFFIIHFFTIHFPTLCFENEMR